MTIAFSPEVRNGRLDAVETVVGASPRLKIYSGSAPARSAAATGTLLAEIVLPSDWMAAAASGSKAKSGTWSVAAVGAGTAGYFRIENNGATIVHIQGTVTASGGGGDMTLDNTSIAVGQTVTISTFTLTDGNA